MYEICNVSEVRFEFKFGYFNLIKLPKTEEEAAAADVELFYTIFRFSVILQKTKYERKILHIKITFCYISAAELF